MFLFGKHKKIREDISAYVDGQFDSSGVQRMEAHLESCESCRVELEELRATVTMLRSVEQAPAPRLFALTPEQAELPAVPAPTPVPAYQNGMRFAGAALAAALAVVVVIDIGGSGSSDEDYGIITNRFNAMQEYSADRHMDDRAPAPAAAPGADEKDDFGLPPDLLTGPDGAADGDDTVQDSAGGILDDDIAPGSRETGDDAGSLADQRLATIVEGGGYNILRITQIALAAALVLVVIGYIGLCFTRRRALL